MINSLYINYFLRLLYRTTTIQVNFNQTTSNIIKLITTQPFITYFLTKSITKINKHDKITYRILTERKEINIILTKFLKESLKKIKGAGIPASDKIKNFMEALEPYHLQNQLTGYYSANQLLNHAQDRLTADQIKKLKPLSHPGFLDPAKLFKFHQGKIKLVNNQDVNQAFRRTLEILKDSNQ